MWDKTTPESAKVVCIKHDRTMEKWLNLWIYDKTTNRKKVVYNIIMRLEAKKTYD